MGNQVIAGFQPLFKKLDAFYDAQVQSNIPSTIQPELFHYTGVEGLKGIVETNKLHATSAYYLNDSSEIEYGCKLVLEIIEEWLKANAAQEPVRFPLRVLQWMANFLKSPESRMSRQVGIYVTCFCENGDLLSQWRAYGQVGGYSIGMRSVDLELKLQASGFYNPRLRQVIYDPVVQRGRINSIIRGFIEILGDPEVQAGLAIPKDLEHFKSFAGELMLFLQELLIEEVAAFKNPAFSEEGEWRIITRPRIYEWRQQLRQQQNANANHAQSGNGKTEIKYKYQKGILVPYMELSPPNGEVLPIHSVRFGPSLDKVKAETSLIGFLIKHGYQKIRISGCNMPVLL